MSNEIIMNSLGDVAVIRAQVVGFTVDNGASIQEAGWVWVLTACLGSDSPNSVPFEVSNDQGKLNQLAERFRKLFEGE